MASYVGARNEKGEVVPALMFSHCQWENLYNVVKKGTEGAQEARQKALELEERRILSRKMADTWENTYVNIRKRRYEKRKERLLKEQKYKEERFEELRKESEKVKNKIRDKAKEVFFFERDACKSLHSAFRTSETEAERLAQLEFDEKLKKIDREIETKYAESILNDVQRYHEEQEEQKRQLAERKKQLKIEAKEMLKEAEDRKNQESERQRLEDREDMEIMARQMRQVIENERLEKLRRKEYERNNLLKNREEVRNHKLMLQKEEDEENMALQIIANGKMNIARIRKEREEQMLKASRTRHAAMSNKLNDEAQEKQRKEEESYERALQEKCKIETDAKEKERQYREMLKKERIDEHLKYMKEEEERLAKERELLKWEILRRFEREEINNKFSENSRMLKKKQAQECRETYIKQIETAIDKRMEEKQIDLEACQRSQELWELNDMEFLKYAEMVREESRKKGRPLYPLDAAIYNFKKNTGLFDKDRNFIWDSKLKRPEGIVSFNATKQEDSDLNTRLQNCINVQSMKVIGQEVCGCPKRTNGI